MNVLIVGGGGREHALAWRLSRDIGVKKIFCAPGNAGTVSCSTNVPLAADNCDGIVDWVREEHIDLVMIGPEQPIVLGLADRLRSQGCLTVGPGREAARLESSKIFAKQFMARHGIAAPEFRVAATLVGADRGIAWFEPGPFVIKADGLAGGKGSFICENREQALHVIRNLITEHSLGKAGERIVLERYLVGREASVFVLTDGESYEVLEPARDFKRAFDGDRGPNTGGMGAYSPVAEIDQELLEKIKRAIIEPTLAGLQREGMIYQGFLYFGLMLTADGPFVLEYNVRLGDPETQPLMMRLDSELLPHLMAAAQGRLGAAPSLQWRSQAAVCVVSAVSGYPGPTARGAVIRGLEPDENDCVVFMAGASLQHGTVVTTGGRVLAATALGETRATAARKAYARLANISYEGMWRRRDIGL